MSAHARKPFSTRLPFIAGALFAVFSHGALAAESPDYNQMQARINQLENQVQTLSRALFRGEKLPDAMSGTGAPSSAFEDRLSLFESKQRDLTGQIEKIVHDVQEMKDSLAKALADNDARLRQMESSGATLPSPPSPETGSSLPSLPDNTLGTLSKAGPNDASALYETAFADISARKYDSAANKFKNFLSNYPTHQLAANAQYWLAETHYVRGDYREAAKLFAQGYQDHPKAPKAADSLLKLGLSLARLDKKEDACLSLQQLQKEFPGDRTPVIRRAAQEMKQLGCP